jgi:hypothetical protein
MAAVQPEPWLWALITTTTTTNNNIIDCNQRTAAPVYTQETALSDMWQYISL